MQKKKDFNFVSVGKVESLAKC